MAGTTVVDVPFSYIAEVVPRGCRNPSREWYRASVPVLVPELDPGEAPPALRVAEVARGERAGEAVVSREVTMLWDGDRLLRPLLGPDGAHMSLDGLREALSGVGMVKGNQDVRWAENPLLVYHNSHDGRSVNDAVFKYETREEGAAGVRIYHSDDRPAKAAEAARRGAALGVVGGMVYRRCPEPTWGVSQSYRGRARVSVRSLSPGTETDVVLFRADAAADALALAEAIGRSDRGGPPRVVEGSIEVLLPAALRRQPTSLNAFALFRKVLPDALRKACDCRSGAPLRALADARDAEAGWHATNDVAHVHAAYAALRAASECDWTPRGTDEGADARMPDAADLFLRAYDVACGPGRDMEHLAGFGPAA